MEELSDHLSPRLRLLTNSMTQYMDQQFLQLDLTSTQSLVLHYLALHENEPVYPKDIEKCFHLTHPTVSGILQRLEAKGFLTIEPDANDRRCKRVSLTARAHCCEAAVGSALHHLDETMTAGMSPTEHEMLLRLLDLALANLKQSKLQEECNL